MLLKALCPANTLLEVVKYKIMHQKTSNTTESPLLSQSIFVIESIFQSSSVFHPSGATKNSFGASVG